MSLLLHVAIEREMDYATCAMR